MIRLRGFKDVLITIHSQRFFSSLARLRAILHIRFKRRLCGAGIELMFIKDHLSRKRPRHPNTDRTGTGAQREGKRDAGYWLGHGAYIRNAASSIAMVSSPEGSHVPLRLSAIRGGLITAPREIAL